VIRTLLALFRPLKAIALELHILRELYELDLASRENPVYRVTEKPHGDDTEVTYAGVEPEPKPKHRTWFNR
jgi:hypothetical protein